MRFGKFLLAIAGLLLIVLSVAEARVNLVDKQGRSVLVDIVGVEDEYARVRRMDGELFKIYYRYLSPESLSKVKAWKNREYISNNIELRITQAELDSQGKSTSSTESKTRTYCYSIKAKNTGPKTLPALIVRYQIYIRREKRGAKKDTDPKHEVKKGRLEIPSLKTFAESSVKTLEFKLLESNLRNNWSYGNKNLIDSAEDELEGIWIRIYSDGILVLERSDPGNLKTDKSWKKVKGRN